MVSGVYLFVLWIDMLLTRRVAPKDMKSAFTSLLILASQKIFSIAMQHTCLGSWFHNLQYTKLYALRVKEKIVFQKRCNCAFRIGGELCDMLLHRPRLLPNTTLINWLEIWPILLLLHRFFFFHLSPSIPFWFYPFSVKNHHTRSIRPRTKSEKNKQVVSDPFLYSCSRVAFWIYTSRTSTISLL